MPITQKVFQLNSFGDGSLERRTRTSSSGRSSDRWSVTVDAKPLKLDFDTKTLGAGVALKISSYLRDRIANIDATASESTQVKRKHAATAFASGKRWAMKRYAGGRIGGMTPNKSPRLFNDSGRFVRSIVARPTRDNNWVINVAANRFNAAQLGSESALVRIVDRLREFVPEFGSAARLAGVAEISTEIQKSVNALFANRPKGEQFRKFAQEALKVALQEISKTED